MVFRLKPMGKPTTLKKSYKFWTESRYCMVLGLKPIGKPTTLKKSYKFCTELRSCMVLGLKLMGKLDTPRKSKYQTRPNNMHGTSDDAFSPLEVCVDTNSTPHGRG